MREDIQCLRGLAIIFVYLYHLHSTVFVNGFLGVDIFFVISGFLMAKNLTKNKISKISDFFVFYYKRFKRILPMYYLIIFMTILLVHFFLGEFWWESNRRYSVASLFVVTNHLVITDSQDYFLQFQTDDKSPNLFLHLWSLGVEMQFYLIVPIIFFALQILQNDYLKLTAVILTTIIGCIPFLLLNQHFAFNFMPLRLCIFLAVLSFCILPQHVDIQILRPLVTLATALVIALESHDNQLLKSKFLVYIGNISYIVYLVHWPILSVFSVKSSFQCDLFVTLLTLLTSIFLHHLFEKQYLKLGWKSITSLLVLLLLANAFQQYSIRNHSFWKVLYPSKIQEIVDKNVILQDVWEREPIIDHCVELVEDDPNPLFSAYKYCLYPKGNGNFFVMMIGNSYVKNLNEHIRAHFKYNYSEYRYTTMTAGFGIYADPGAQFTVDRFKEQVEQFKPDVLFISARYSDYIKQPLQENDPIVQEITENIKFYEKFTKKIYILGALPLFKTNFLNHFMQYIIQKREDLETLHLDQKLADEEKKNVEKRFSMVKCQKCKFYDLSHVFAENGKYLMFDRKQMLAYVDNSIHITAPGLGLCEPVFAENAREIMDTI